MKQIAKNYVVVISFILFSCSTQENRTLDGIFGAIQEIDYMEISLEFANSPRDIILADSLLIFIDNIDDRRVIISDIRSQTLLRAVFRPGQGPNDIILPVSISYIPSESAIGIFQRQAGVYSEHKLLDLLQGRLDPTKRISFTNTGGAIGLINRPDRLLRANSKFIGVGFYSYGSLGIYDETGYLQAIIDTHPQFIRNLESHLHRYLFGQGSIAFNESSNVLMFASTFTGRISFYRFTGFEAVQIAYYNLDKNSRFENRIRGGGRLLETGILPDDVYHSAEVFATDNYFYVLYYGVSRENVLAMEHSYILRFTKEGKAVQGYRVNTRLRSFTVSSDDRVLYGITLDDNHEYALARIILDF